MNPSHRLAQIRGTIASEGVDGLIVASSSNVTYLTGFEHVFDDEPSSVCVVTAESATVFVDSRYVEAAQTASRGGPWRVAGPESDVWESALALVDADGGIAFGLEASIPHTRFARVAEGRQGRIHAADGWVERARLIKEPAEVELIAKAAGIADAAFAHVLASIRPGVTEIEIALELEIFMRRNGSEGVAFPSIVASGPNSSRPHAHAGARRFERGDLITLDFGARVDGYCSDMTRTVALGAPEAELRAIYAVVLAANEVGLAATRAGRTGAEIDAEARRVISQAGYGDKFGHGLGHGVGLEVHEAPSISARGTASVRAGSVVTVEPGVYVPGVGGVRIEDLVVVGDHEPTVLTHSPKELMEL